LCMMVRAKWCHHGPSTNLFAEMDAIADELRTHEAHIPDDDQVAWRQLQRARLPNLSRQEWLYLFALWCDHYRARRDAKAAARSERLAQLCEERDALFSARASLPPQKHAAVTARIAALAPSSRPSGTCRSPLFGGMLMPSAGIPLRPSFVRSIHARIARPLPFTRVQGGGRQ